MDWGPSGHIQTTQQTGSTDNYVFHCGSLVLPAKATFVGTELGNACDHFPLGSATGAASKLSTSPNPPLTQLLKNSLSYFFTETVDGWVDGWMDGWEGGWMDGKVDGWRDRRMNGWMDEWMDEVGMEGWMDGWGIGGWMGGWMNG